MDRRSLIVMAVVAVALSGVVRWQQKRSEANEPISHDDYLRDFGSYNTDDNIKETTTTTATSQQQQEHQPKKTSEQDRSSSSSHGVLPKTKTALINELERRREDLRRTSLEPALNEVAFANARVLNIRASQSWFPSAHEKASLTAAEQSAAESQRRLARVQEQEQALVARLKPMLGLVSAEFFEEQRAAIKGSLSTVSSIAYNQAWWSSLFNIGRAESLTDILLEFVLQYAMIYAFAYPFAFLYFVLWHGPWTVYAYCESAFDLPMGVAMWLVWSLIMALPGVGLYFGVKFLTRYAQDNNLRAARHRVF